MKILLSIKPQFAEKIFDGSKKFEFRRRVHTDARITTVIVYATKPVGKVVGEFTIAAIHSDAPERLWQKTKKASGISRTFFNDYFGNNDIAHAMEVSNPTKYKKLLPVSDFLPSGVPPQSYAYVS